MGLSTDGRPITPFEGSWADEEKKKRAGETGAMRGMLDKIRVNFEQARELRLRGEIAKALPLEDEAERLIANIKKIDPRAGQIAEDTATEETSRIASLDELLRGMAKMADSADDAGLRKEADALTAAMRKVALVKKAQYESGLHYWIMNGRAFERAWKLKRQKNKLNDNIPITPEDFNSAQECWFEVLEEYQDALMGNHSDFLKFASKKEVERGMDGGSSGATMSAEMTKFHKGLEDEAKEDGVSVGELITRKFGPKGLDDKEAAAAIMSKVSERLMAGSDPGVAFYEAMDYFVTGKHDHDAVDEAIRAIEAAGKHEAMAKEAQFFQNLKNIGQGWVDKAKGWAGEQGAKATDRLQGFGTGPASTLYQQIRQAMPGVQQSLKQLYDGIISSGGKITPQQVISTANPLLDAMEQFFGVLRQAGINPPNMTASRIYTPASGPQGMDQAHFQQWFNQLKGVMKSVNRQWAMHADQALSGQREQARQQRGTGKEINMSEVLNG
jgi:hypothetical protein